MYTIPLAYEGELEWPGGLAGGRLFENTDPSTNRATVGIGRGNVTGELSIDNNKEDAENRPYNIAVYYIIKVKP